jgi:hypothetical protein
MEVVRILWTNKLCLKKFIYERIENYTFNFIQKFQKF